MNSDGQFTIERIYDMINEAKKIDMAQSVFNDPDGKLVLTTQDNQEIIIELNPITKRIEVTEEGEVASLSSNENEVEQLFFEKIPDNVGDPEISLGVNVRLKIAGQEEYSIDQSYVLSGNLERADYDEDGCPDYFDKFPRHPECCGDSDNDGICNELDNCILEYNPFQEDYDLDAVGDSCDVSAFIGGGTSGNTSTLGAFSCSTNEDLIALIQMDPPLNSSVLKQIMLSSSPLHEVVLQALVDAHPLLTEGHLQQIFTSNVLIPPDVYADLEALGLPPGIISVIEMAQDDATEYPYVLYNNAVTNYQLSFFSDAPAEENWTNRVKFHTPDFPLCADAFTGKTDIFVLDVQNGSNTIDVTTEVNSNFESDTLTTTNNLVINNDGLAVEFNEKVGNAYAILTSSDSCINQMDSFEIDFGTNANILNPPTTDTDYDALRYTSYCPGGCITNCGDVGSGITTSSILSDTCYKSDNSYPEWCSHWYTFEDNNTDHPSFVGGTQEDEESVYWEKTFKTIINELQLENLESITVTGEIAYQNITQFFCDTLASNCPMEASLVNAQSVELYNFVSDSWVNIGSMNTDGNISNQQTFEIIYNLADVGDFIGGVGNEQIKARIAFNWDGEPQPGTTSAPAFMLIDYFTIHLKW